MPEEKCSRCGKKIKGKVCRSCGYPYPDLDTARWFHAQQKKEERSKANKATEVHVCCVCGAKPRRRCQKCGDWICFNHIKTYRKTNDQGVPDTKYEYCPDCYEKARKWGYVGLVFFGLCAVFLVFAKIREESKSRQKPKPAKQVVSDEVSEQFDIKIDPVVWSVKPVPADIPENEKAAMRKLNLVKVGYIRNKNERSAKSGILRVIQMYPRSQAAEEARHLLKTLPH